MEGESPRTKLAARDGCYLEELSDGLLAPADGMEILPRAGCGELTALSKVVRDSLRMRSVRFSQAPSRTKGMAVAATRSLARRGILVKSHRPHPQGVPNHL